ncbi:hypothetical protein L6R52_32775 [Myxococcota bacterium]|nr:hypothetical protein [Myxococcota bacterium]
MFASALPLLFALASAPAGGDEVAPAWLTFDVVNPEQAGRHRILHLDEVLGPSKVSVPDLPKARVLLVVTTLADDCGAASSFCVALAPVAKEIAAAGGLVLVVLLDPEEALPKAKKELPLAQHPFIITADAHGITRHALGLDRPGQLVAIEQSGRITRIAGAVSDEGLKKLDEAKRLVLGVLKRDKEDGQ